MVTALLGRLAGANEEVGPDPAGDEGLGAVDDIAAVHLAGEGADPGDVRARGGLGDPERTDLLAADPGYQPPLFLLLGPKLPDRRHRDLRGGAKPRGDATGGARARQFLDVGGVVDIVAALAAVPGRELEPEEAELARPPEQVAGELAGGLPLLDVGGDLLGHPRAHRLAQVLVLLGERRDQRPLPSVLYDRDGDLQSSSIV